MIIARLVREKRTLEEAANVLLREEEGARISIEEMLEPETIERIGCDRTRDLGVCFVRICGEVRSLQDEIAQIKQAAQLKAMNNQKFTQNCENAAQARKTALRTHKSYGDGYEAGLSWKDSYVPGGPFCFSPRPEDSQDMREMANRTLEAHKAWMLGFHEGYAKNLNT